MALTPEDIEQHTFKVSRRGYDKVEVDRFLGQVATSYRELDQRAEAAATDAAVSAWPGRRTATADDDLADGGSPTPGGELFARDGAGDDFNRLGTEVASVLRTAHASVAQLRHEAEIEAAVIRQRAEREIADLRHEADTYAARVRAEADAYAHGKVGEAEVATRDADRLLADAQARADAKLADTERRVSIITEQAEANAQARSQEILAEADRRLAAAKSTEDALRARLIAAHGDLRAALEQFTAPEASPAEAPAPAEPSMPPTLDLTGDRESEPVLDLTEDGGGATVAGEPAVPPGWPGAPPLTGRIDDLFGDQGTAPTALVGAPAPAHAPEAETAAAAPVVESPAPADAPSPSVDHGADDEDEASDPLPDIVRSAIGRAVQSAVSRGDAAAG